MMINVILGKHPSNFDTKPFFNISIFIKIGLSWIEEGSDPRSVLNRIKVGQSNVPHHLMDQALEITEIYVTEGEQSCQL